VRVVGVSGSLRRGSLNTELLRVAARAAPNGSALELWHGLDAVPAYDADVEEPEPPAVASFREALRDADAVLVATPEYNGSIPGALKNAFDWASRPAPAEGPLWGKPVAVVSASTGSFGAIWAQAELNKVLGRLGARVVETNLAVAKADERLARPDEELRDDLRRVLDLLAAEVAADASVPEPAAAAAAPGALPAQTLAA
jgi:chromate reductase